MQTQPFPPEPFLRQLINRSGNCFSQTIGPHPEFEHLGALEDTTSPVTSVFVDIKSSTSLGFKYPSRKVKNVKQSLLETAVIVAQAFDGHVHRLQGDGIVIFFRNNKVADTVVAKDAINASVTLLALIESVINPKLSNLGVDPIKIRIGIDHDPEALWSHYGIHGCSEITASGRYVDLAAKLQGKAAAMQ